MEDVTKEEFVAICRRSAELCNNDLTTLMVREYPSLAGIYGAILLRHENEKE